MLRGNKDIFELLSLVTPRWFTQLLGITTCLVLHMWFRTQKPETLEEALSPEQNPTDASGGGTEFA